MTKFTRWLGGTAVAALAGVLLFGAAGAFSVQEVAAQPPPPATFTGLVTVDGEPAAVGVSVEARIGGNSCGVGTTVEAEDEVNTRYTVDVTAGANCGTEGATVTFYVQGQAAQETGSWQDGPNHLNLTVVAVADPTPTPADPTPTPDPADPTPTPDDPDDPTPDPTPAPPDTGAGAMGSTSSTSGMALVLAIAVLGAAGFGIAGAAAARRTNS